MRVGLFVFLWYVLNATFIVSYRIASDAVHNATTLTSLQILFGAILFSMPLTRKEIHGSFVASYLFLAGTFFTNVAFSHLNLLTALSVKASEPLFSYAMTRGIHA